jgi:hypothetical protein
MKRYEVRFTTNTMIYKKGFDDRTEAHLTAQYIAETNNEVIHVGVVDYEQEERIKMYK